MLQPSVTAFYPNRNHIQDRFWQHPTEEKQQQNIRTYLRKLSKKKNCDKKNEQNWLTDGQCSPFQQSSCLLFLFENWNSKQFGEIEKKIQIDKNNGLPTHSLLLIPQISRYFVKLLNLITSLKITFNINFRNTQLKVKKKETKIFVFIYKAFKKKVVTKITEF